MTQNRTASKSSPRSSRPAGESIATGTRAQRAAERRDAILAAALDEFAAQGFAAARLDDVAKRAGVAKGTIYLYFADKETLFQELIRTHLSPVVGGVIHASHAELPLRLFAEQLIEVFVRDVLGTRRRDVIRLMITEGQRFPKLAEFYYREVIAKVMEAVRALLRRAYERGELKDDALVRHPQLLAAPGIMSIVWSGLFERYEPLDVRSLMRTHFEILFGKENAP